MKIEEARKVIWLKSNPRPLGELLDEGYLTEDRLNWAAQWAYSPTLQQAAKVLLDSINFPEKKTDKSGSQSHSAAKPIEIGISLEKARTTLWPLPPYKGESMGSLVDSKQLTLKDLGYAAENAWDEKVRQAAIALSLARFEQVVKEPVSSAGFIHVVSGGRSYSEQKQFFLTLLEGMVLGFLVAFMIFIVGIEIINLRMPHPESKPLSDFVSSPSGIIALVIILAIFLLFGWLFNFLPKQITKRLDNQIEEYRLGQEGEDRVVEIILQALDGNWHLFRNIGLPGRNKGDLDLVLVGPPGVWVLEVKNFRGEYRNIGESWEYKRGKSWKTASANPSKQALKNAYRLKNFLKADGLNVFVNGAVIWANSENTPFVENPSIAVWPLNRLPDELGNIWQDKKIPEPDRKIIIAKLTKLCDRQKQAAS